MTMPIYNLADKVRIITCPPQMGDLADREGFIVDLLPPLPGHGLPRAQIHLRAGKMVEISTVFLQIIKSFYVPVEAETAKTSKISSWTPERRAKYQATMAAKKATVSAREIDRAPTCRRCGHSSPLMMGVSRCEQVDYGGRRCGGAVTR